MNILISGGSGLIGTALVSALRERNHHVKILVRHKSNNADEFFWRPELGQIDEKAFVDIDSIIHLAGATIGKRWTKEYKKELYASRIDSAELLFKTCAKLQVKLKSFISASGINYYGTYTSDEVLTENDQIKQQDFLSKLSAAWENAGDDFSSIADRRVWLRTAMVLAKNGGSFPKLKKITDYNLGTAIGTGTQWMNWIHLDDIVNIYIYAVENENMMGKYNAVADETPTNKKFMKELAKVDGKFFSPIAVPGFMIKFLMGEMSEIILQGTRASNQKIKNEGFTFKFSSLESAFKYLV